VFEFYRQKRQETGRGGGGCLKAGLKGVLGPVAQCMPDAGRQ